MIPNGGHRGLNVPRMILDGIHMVPNGPHIIPNGLHMILNWSHMTPNRPHIITNGPHTDAAANELKVSGRVAF